MMAPEPADRPAMIAVAGALTGRQAEILTPGDETQPTVVSPQTLHEWQNQGESARTSVEPVVPGPSPGQQAPPSSRPTALPPGQPVEAQPGQPAAPQPSQPAAPQPDRLGVLPPARSAAPTPAEPGAGQFAGPPPGQRLAPQSSTAFVPPPSRPVPRSASRSRRRPAVAAIIAAAVVAAALVVGYLLIGNRNTGNTDNAGVASTAPPASTTATSQESTVSETLSSTAVESSPTAAELAAAITDYYALMPANTDEGWALLTPDFQSTIAKNRESYQSFWDGVAGVAATDVTGTAPDTAEATITYRFKDGTTAVERTSYQLVDDNGVLKIDSSAVLTSQTG
jgi:hypothetical protein